MKCKRVIYFVLILMATFIFVACKNSQGSNKTDPEIKGSEVEDANASGSEGEGSIVEDSEYESAEVVNSDVSNTDQSDDSNLEAVTEVPKETPKVYMNGCL